MSTREAAEAFFDAKDVDGTGTMSLKELGDVLRGQGYSKKQIKVSCTHHVDCCSGPIYIYVLAFFFH